MNTEKLYYTDGHEVMVTATALKVRNKMYLLAGIIRHKISTLSPPRTPGLVLLGLGLVFGFIGLFALLPVGFIPSMEIAGRWATINDYAIALGGLLILAGLITLIAMKRRYAVHIQTATEDTDVIVSNEREYIASIVDGLDQAIVERRS